jgi:hypothetical protein
MAFRRLMRRRTAVTRTASRSAATSRISRREPIGHAQRAPSPRLRGEGWGEGADESATPASE